jgi:hypothetical protein
MFSASIRMPISIDVRPTQFTLAIMRTSSPTKIGSRKSIRSTETVTQVVRAWRIAQTAAVLSISDMIAPPKTWPRAFSSVGIISAELTCCDSLTRRAGRGWSVTVMK